MRDNKDTQPMNKPMLSASEKQAILDDKEKLQEMLGAGELSESGYTAASQIDDISIDKDGIRRKIAGLQKQLDDYSPRKITNAGQRDRLFKRRKELEDKFIDALETWRDIGVMRRDDPDWHEAYKKAIDRPKYEPAIAEWKRIGLMLDPDDRFINDLNRLRKKS